jgi:hypothetical protein
MPDEHQSIISQKASAATGKNCSTGQRIEFIPSLWPVPRVPQIRVLTNGIQEKLKNSKYKTKKKSSGSANSAWTEGVDWRDKALARIKVNCVG